MPNSSLEITAVVKNCTVINDNDVKLAEDEFVYTGNEIKPTVEVKSLGKTLVENKDYSLKYEKNNNPGAATVTIHGIGQYTGTIRKSFSIYGDIKEISIETQHLTIGMAPPNVAVAESSPKGACVDTIEIVWGESTDGTYLNSVPMTSAVFEKGKQYVYDFSGDILNDYYRVSDDTVYKYNGIIREAGNLDASLMKAHELTYYPQKSSTCLGSGNCEYWYCKECDKYYSDKEAKTEIEKDSWVIKAKGHEWNECGAKFRYKSSDTSIATVDKNGKIKGIKKGTCTIYVYSINGLTKKARITVK